MRALAFSGGKDSLACWFLCRPQTVIWVDTGKNFPETLATIKIVERNCENFIRVQTDQAAQTAEEGLPADVVPIDWTKYGQTFTGPKPVTLQSYLGCCYANISAPLHAMAKKLGVTELIRGQRKDETHKGAARDGDMVDGIRYLQPIEDWSAEQVLRFLRDHMPLPEHLFFSHSSLDCYDCTAYVNDHADRQEWMQREHPVLFAQYRTRMQRVESALTESLKPMGSFKCKQ